MRRISWAMASFVAAGTSYATHGRHMVPFYAYYSMFGFQRIGDLMWLAGDMRALVRKRIAAGESPLGGLRIEIRLPLLPAQRPGEGG